MPSRTKKSPKGLCSACEKAEESYCTHCPVCGEDQCEEHCYESQTGEHEAGPRSGSIPDGVDFVVDFTCRHCGQSGGLAVDPRDIQWD